MKKLMTKKLNMSKKRNLSESSEDPDDPGVYQPPPLPAYSSNPGMGSLTSSYYGSSNDEADTPSASFQTADGQKFKKPKIEPEGRRVSQASTASSVSGTDDDALDRDSGLLSRALESTSSSDTEDDAVHQGFSQNGNAPIYASKGPELAAPGFLPGGGHQDSGGYLPRSTPSSVKQRGSSKPGSTTAYSSQAERMMSKMGYQSGTGLGKAAQGRVEPVTVSTQRGRRGLGHIIEGLESDDSLDWTPEEVEVNERVSWLPANHQPTPTIVELREWMKTGRRNTDISGETKFCDPDVLLDVLSCKSIFDKLESHELMKARARSNPYETIAKGIFMNRAAMKMANMDKVFDFMFSNPTTEDGRSLVHEDEPLYFADVCAGPGGFSEYILWRKKWKAKGYGFTLQDGKHDFKLADFYAGPPEGFEPHHGVGGPKGDGNVFLEDNILAFQRHVLENTNRLGIHFMMADGGFSVEGSENIQEILSKQLYLCQCIVALAIVRTDGHFVCKLFDLFTPFSIGLVYLMYRAFKVVCIHKPVTSRPANSERYIICKWKRPDTEDILQYMLQVNRVLTELELDMGGRTRSDKDVLEIVPESVLQADPQFLQYMIDSNNNIGRAQVTGLEKIAIFYRNRNLLEKRQTDVKKECLDFWKVPDQGRFVTRHEDDPQGMAARLTSTQILRSEEIVVTNQDDLAKYVRSIYDWRFVVSGVYDNGSDSQQEIRTFLLSIGRQRVYVMSGDGGNRWKSITSLSNCTVELPAETLLYVELVWELKGEGKAQKKVMAVHVIDGLFLAGEDIRQLHFMERHKMLSLFLKVMNKPSRSDLTKLRIKTVFKLDELSCETNSMWNLLKVRALKGKGEGLVLYNPEADPDGSEKFFQAKGLLLYKHVKDPYMMFLSKSTGRKYYFNTMIKKTVENFSTPKDGIAEFEACHSRRVVCPLQPLTNDQIIGLTKESINDFVTSSMKK